MARRQIEVSNDVAAELAGSQDRVLRELQDQLGCEIFLRGNLITLDGDAEAVAAGANVVRELSALVGRGHDLGPATVESVASVLGESQSPTQVLEDVVWRHRSLRVAPKSVNQKRYVDAIRSHTVTFGIGPAGTGKTFLAIAMAVAALSRREVNRIILTRPAVEAGERLGFLPGDLMAKVDPYLRPLFDAMNDMLDPERVTAHLEKGVIEVAPLAFMRGRTLNDSFVILDEAQNTSPEQMKMFLTRLGFGSKMVVNGDVSQIDLPREQRSGLVEVGEILRAVDGIGVIHFGNADVVRHKLVQRIVQAYADHAEQAAPELRPAVTRRGRLTSRGACGRPRPGGVRSARARARRGGARDRRHRGRARGGGLRQRGADRRAQRGVPRQARAPPTCSPSRSTRTARPSARASSETS